MARVALDAAEIDDLSGYIKAIAKQYPEAFKAGARDFMTEVYQESLKECPADTGVLRESGLLDVGEEVITIKYTAPYAAAVHNGYKRHWIAPRRRHWLRWEVGRIARLSARAPRSGAKFAFSKGHFVPRARSHTEPQPFLVRPFLSALNRGRLLEAVIMRFKEVKA